MQPRSSNPPGLPAAAAPDGRSLTLRPATNADRAEVERLVFGVLAEYGLQPDPTATDADLRDLEGAYRKHGGRFDVLTDPTGRVVGCVGLCPVSASVCELRKMYLAPSVRGQGWGSRLLRHALGRARELGFRRIVLETASVLREAIALYERYGFRRYTPTHLACRCDVAYALELAPAAAPLPSPSGRRRGCGGRAPGATRAARGRAAG